MKRPAVFFLSSYSGSNDPYTPSSAINGFACSLLLFPPSVSQIELALADGRGGRENKTTAKKMLALVLYIPSAVPPPPPCVEKFVMVRKVQVVPTIRLQPWGFILYIYNIYNTHHQHFSPLYPSHNPIPFFCIKEDNKKICASERDSSVMVFCSFHPI
jgi:hypothetical protein